MTAGRKRHIFEAFGVELEYMIVSSNSLDVRPIADQLLRDDDGKFHSEVAHGEISWSNELVLHVIELKTTHPAKSLDQVAEKFQQHIRSANHLLEPWDSRLMPTAMHPWMNPHREMKLWPHDHSAVYQAFDKLFDCRGHGWANLQSVHLNLPFADEEEFGQLHAAVRLLLPLLPALAASSPVIDGRITGLCDQRLEVYRHNAQSIPQVSGQVVPEPVFTYGDYQQRILQPLYKAIRPYDREGILQHEWLNARGAIARFDRQTIEIRVLDVQECPAADLALLQVIIGVLRDLVAGTWSTYEDQQQFGTEPLAELLQDVIRSGDETVISHPEYLRVMGWKGDAPVTARQLWQHLVYQGDLAKEIAATDAVGRVLDVVFSQGPLSRRIVSALIQSPGRDTLKRIYQRLCDCLEAGSMFTV